MPVCVTWSQPDANHFNGLCTNEFKRTTSTGGKASKCDVCATPRQPGQTCESAGTQFQNCRNWDGTPIEGSIRPDQWISTWVPFFKLTITIPALYRTGAPWYNGTTGNCEQFYIGSFTLGTLDWKCSQWATFLTTPDERYKKLITSSCSDRSEDPRIQLNWSSFNPVWTATINFRIFSTNHSIFCSYNTTSPVSPLTHDCRKPISFQTWRNSAGDWQGNTTTRAISDTPGASVTLEPLFL